jgi:Na+-transporting methylmalonyl-CoA/oxaloacetate decarboxylase gamma subunit
MVSNLPMMGLLGLLRRWRLGLLGLPMLVLLGVLLVLLSLTMLIQSMTGLLGFLGKPFDDSARKDMQAWFFGWLRAGVQHDERLLAKLEVIVKNSSLAN